MNASRTLTHRVIDVAAIVTLLAMGVWGFAPVFASAGWMAAGWGGLVCGVAIALVASWRRWSFLAGAAAVVGAYLVLGGALALPSTTIAGVVPTLATVRGLALGSFRSWRALLTVDVPTVGF